MTRFCIPLVPSYFKSEAVDTTTMKMAIKSLNWDSGSDLERECTLAIESTTPIWSCCEVWLDYLEGDIEELVHELLETHRNRVVFIFRRLGLENTKLPFELVSRLIKNIAEHRGWMDLDIDTQPEAQAIFQKHAGANLIASYHNYSLTPSDEELKQLLTAMEKLSPRVFKAATFCNSEKDALRLLNLLITTRQSGKNAIMLGMGPHGLATRVMGTLWGNYLCFAPESTDSSSAPGQLSYSQLRSIINTIEFGAPHAR